jgi:hypothetical protein
MAAGLIHHRPTVSKEAAVLNLSVSIFVALLSLPPVDLAPAAEASDATTELPVRASVEESMLSDSATRAYLAHLLRLGGGGFRNTERAAFLVIDDDGNYRCLLWPYHNGFLREEFHGTIPPGTVAVMHTHPNRYPHPSLHDQGEAVRIGLPFLVVSRQHIYAVTLEGRVLAIVEREWWSRDAGIDREHLCQNIPKDIRSVRGSRR